MGARAGTGGADPVRTLVEGWVAEGRLPGAVWRVESRDGVLTQGAAGMACLDPERVPATAGTLYDLASLTKALTTAPLALLLSRDGRPGLDEPLVSLLPELAGTPYEGATPEDCLLHRTGLPAWAPLYVLARSREEVPAAVAALRPVYPPRGGALYSCLGPILLGIAMERATGRDLAALFEERVARPLGLRDLVFHPGPHLRARCAATERGNSYERDLAGDAGRGYTGWRDGMIRGEVHDGNAFFLGGAAGNAGLFGTAEAVAAAGRDVLFGERGLLRPEERASLLRPGTPEPLRRALFGSLGTNRGSPGSPLSRAAVGHSGFTGTSLWLDPERGAVLVLLSNRVHPEAREGFEMDALRRTFHEQAAALLDEEA